MKKNLSLILLLSLTIGFQSSLLAQNNDTKNAATVQSAIKVPVVVNGEVQKIPEFEKPEEWIRHDLWVEANFDSDKDVPNTQRPLALNYRSFMSRAPILQVPEHSTKMFSGP
jgi:hypothetical protein